MNNQQVLDFAYDFLIQQGGPCLNRKGVACFEYQGLKDPIRALIPSNVWKPKAMEGYHIDELMYYQDSIKELFKDVDYSLLCNIQYLHDIWHYYDCDNEWLSKEFTLLAKRFNLDNIAVSILKPKKYNNIHMTFVYLAMGIMAKHGKLWSP